MNFITLDFETATPDHDSACEIGLTIVRNFKVEKTLTWLIKPKQYPNFHFFNIKIHGIHPEAVANSPSFIQLWPEIRPYLESELILAHNALFDFNVLKRSLQGISINELNIRYSCTYQLSKAHWSGLAQYDLTSLCKSLNIEIGNHRAGPDSRACAELAIQILKERNITEQDQFFEKLKIPIIYLAKTTSSIIDNSLSESIQINPNRDSIFYEKNVAFTGTLSSMTRSSAIQVINGLGGIGQEGLNKKTNFLIVGQQDFRVVGDSGLSSKQKKAIAFKQDGVDIEIISEEEFLRCI